MPTRIAVVDYLLEDHDALIGALEEADAELDVTATSDPEELAQAQGIVLAGQATFADAIGQIRAMGLEQHIKAQIVAGKPTLGIGVGMQLFFSVGREIEPGQTGDHVVDGLKIRPGSTPPVAERDYYGTAFELPHEGFAPVHRDRRCATPLLEGIPDGESYYYRHYFATPTGPWVQAWTTYSATFPAVVDFDRKAFGVQFHPELSGPAGIRLLARFARICREAPDVSGKVALPQGPQA